MSPITALPGPPWTDTGDPGAFTNNDCCGAFEGALPEGHEMNNDVHEAVSNRLNRPARQIVAGIFIAEVTTRLLSYSI
jgi:hypothetical protein